MLAVIETIKKIGNKRSIGTKYSRNDREGNFCDKKEPNNIATRYTFTQASSGKVRTNTIINEII